MIKSVKVLEARRLSKIFDQAERPLQVLRNINLELASGEFIAIVGKSGSGKSTLLSLLAALDRPTQGEIWINGEQVDQWSEEQLTQLRRSVIGFVFQSYHLIPTLTALENVMVPAQLAGNEKAEKLAKELLGQVDLALRYDHYPHQLSGGEQQRVAICRALINDPKIIFADEPTGNLDTAHGERVMELLSSLRKNRALVLVTHDHALARRADRVIEIRDGMILNS